VNDFMRHRISNMAGLLGKGRTPWSTTKPDLRSSSLSHPGEKVHGNTPAATEPALRVPRPSRPATCECADVRAWLGPRRAGRRTLP
jgi:hypothetical protein